MPRRTSHADAITIRVVLLTLNGHAAGAVRRAADALSREIPGFELAFHAASEWDGRSDKLARCIADIQRGYLIIATMLFTDEHIRAILPALAERRASCDAMVACMSAGEVVKLTRMGGFSMDGSQKGPMALLKRLRGK